MKVYSCPDEIKPPEYDFTNYDHAKTEAVEKAHAEALIAWLRANGYTGKNTGKILRVPYADGSAQYMFADGSKSCLINLPYGDAWDSPDVAFLPKKEVLRRIGLSDKRAAFFAKGAK